ncbi:MAG: hypothetical protein FWG03_03960 [Clostridiales bacterium]|nr:hypothetical protein [Clostridiales bacterium]
MTGIPPVFKQADAVATECLNAIRNQNWSVLAKYGAISKEDIAVSNGVKVTSISKELNLGMLSPGNARTDADERHGNGTNQEENRYLYDVTFECADSGTVEGGHYWFNSHAAHTFMYVRMVSGEWEVEICTGP